MIDIAPMVPDLQKLVKELHADLITRSQERPEVEAKLRALHADRKKQHRSAQAYEAWREEFLTQVAVAWVLGCVFVRYLEDNRFLRDFYLAGPDADGLAQARHNFDTFMHQHPDDAERNYLLGVFGKMQTVHAVKDLFAPGKTALWAVEPSNAAAMRLLAFWQEIDTESGDLARRFDTARGDTRFLGDLYQELSIDIQKKYALFQTPVFVEEFILDRTLEPAIAEFGFENVRLIDPTCGSGHFLLGAFARLFRRWETKWQQTGDLADTNRIDLAQRALNQVYGVDVNPYAVAICRFRLIIAALHVCQQYDLEHAPDWKLKVTVGDSLIFGDRWVRASRSKKDARLPGGVGTRITGDLEDPAELNHILGQQYHVVVGNPPYITVKDGELNTLYRQLYKVCSGKYHLSAPFTERFFDLCLAGAIGDIPGYVGLIIDNAFMKRSFGKTLVKYLKDIDLTHVINTDNVPLPGHGTPTVILLGRNRSPVGLTVRAVLGIKGEVPPPDDPTKSKVWQSIVDMLTKPGTQNEFISVGDIERTCLEAWPWSMGGGGSADLKVMLDNAGDQQLKQICEAIGIFGMTNADEVFLGSVSSFLRKEVETHFLRQLQLGDELRDWQSTEGNYAIFPYRKDDKLVELSDVPKLHQWLWPTRTTLGNRATFEKRTYFSECLPWWKWHQVALDRLHTPLTIAFAEIASHNHFVLDRGGKTFKQTAPIIKLPTSANEAEHLKLLGLLNSSICGFWLRQVCFPKGGDQVGKTKSRVRRTWWEERFAFASTPLGDFPIPTEKPFELSKRIDTLAQEYASLRPSQFVPRCMLNREALDKGQDEAQAVRQKMIALQEELDWQVYHLYRLTPQPLTYSGEPPPLNLGERAFEIIMARKVQRAELETAWFERHGSTPITTIPLHWPEDYRQLVERRIQFIESDRNIGLIEQPEYKRRWSLEKPKKTFREVWHDMEQDALKGWLLDRLETEHYWPRPQPGAHSPAELKSCRQLADRARLDPDFQQGGELYTRRKDFDITALVTELVVAESVPFLPVLRYTDSGLRKREVWERVWDKQRAEDRGEQVEIEVPPKYKRDDFQKDPIGKEGFWRLRGELDVPKERWISYPPLAERQGDEEPSPVVTWAGYHHLDQALALARYFDERKDRDTGSKEWMLPLLAGLEQLLPWLLQWHNEPDQAYGGHRMAEYFREVVLPEALTSQGLTIEQCRAWKPPAPARTRRRRNARR